MSDDYLDRADTLTGIFDSLTPEDFVPIDLLYFFLALAVELGETLLEPRPFWKRQI